MSKIKRQVRASHGEESAEDSQTARLKELIRAVYKRRNPSKLVEVNSLLLKYVGHELEMYHRICEKYSEEPEDVGGGFTDLALRCCPSNLFHRVSRGLFPLSPVFAYDV